MPTVSPTHRSVHRPRLRRPRAQPALAAVFDLRPLFLARNELAEARHHLGISAADLGQRRRMMCCESACAYIRAGERRLLEAVGTAPSPAFRRAMEVELQRVDDLRAEADAAAAAIADSYAPPKHAEVVDLAAARRDREMLAQLRQMHEAMNDAAAAQ